MPKLPPVSLSDRFKQIFHTAPRWSTICIGTAALLIGPAALVARA